MIGDPRDLGHVRLKPRWKGNLFLLLLIGVIVAAGVLLLLQIQRPIDEANKLRLELAGTPSKFCLRRSAAFYLVASNIHADEHCVRR